MSGEFLGKPQTPHHCSDPRYANHRKKVVCRDGTKEEIIRPPFGTWVAEIGSKTQLWIGVCACPCQACVRPPIGLLSNKSSNGQWDSPLPVCLDLAPQKSMIDGPGEGRVQEDLAV